MTVKLGYVVSHPIQYLSPMLRELHRRAGYAVTVLYADEGSKAEQARAGFGVEFEWDVPLLTGYKYHFLSNRAQNPNLQTFSGCDTPEISAIIRDSSFDAVVVHGWHLKSMCQAIWACLRNRIPVLVRSDSHLRTQRSPLHRVAKWPLYSTFIRRFDACLPVGCWSRDYFLHYSAHPTNVFCVPHCVDNNRFDDAVRGLRPQREQLRLAWGIDPRAVVFLFAAKFIGRKRPQDFVHAIERSALAGAPVLGLMTGDGPLRSYCEALVRSRGIPIRFTGFLNQSDIAKAYSAADALVLTSDGSETWGLVVNEAMASGLPCFVSDQVGCGPDLITDGITGASFRMGIVDDLADTIQHYADANRLALMGKNAKQTVRDYSVEATTDKLVATIETVVRKHK